MTLIGCSCPLTSIGGGPARRFDSLRSLSFPASSNVDVCGVHELLGNAIVMKDAPDRNVDLRNEPLRPEAAEAEE